MTVGKLGVDTISVECAGALSYENLVSQLGLGSRWSSPYSPVVGLSAAISVGLSSIDKVASFYGNPPFPLHYCPF